MTAGGWIKPRHWLAVRREILYLLLAGMDVCLFVPIIMALSQHAGRYSPLRAAPAFFVVILVPFYLVRFLDLFDLKETVQRDIGLGVLFVWILLALRFTLYRHVPWYSLAWLGEMARHVGDRELWSQDAAIVVATLVFWWRGLELAKRSLDVEAVGYSFRSGVLIMAVGVALVFQFREWSAAPLVFTYFFFSLMAVALARAEEVGRWRTGVQFPFGGGWLLALAGSAAGVVLIAVMLIAAVSGESVAQAFKLLGPVWELLRMALLFVLSLLFLILQPLLTFLAERLAAMMNNSGEALAPQAPMENPFLPGGEVVEPFAPFAPYEGVLRVLAIAFVVLLVALAFGRIWRERNRLGQVDVDVAGRQRTSGSGLGGRLRGQLDALAGRLGFIDRWRVAASIRRIYAQMVALAGRQGYPRSGSDTPYEHVATLLQLWPDMASQVEAITEAYVRTHYGEVPESAKELDAIRHAWQELQSTPADSHS